MKYSVVDNVQRLVLFAKTMPNSVEDIEIPHFIYFNMYFLKITGTHF